MAIGGLPNRRPGGRLVSEADAGAPRARRPPAVWGTVTVEDDVMVVKLSGWRSVWAVTRGIKVPLRSIVAVDHDPGVYSRVPTKARMITKQRSGVIKLGAYHSAEGWSFWACGLGRNAVVIDTTDYRYSTVVIEVENPVATVRALREAVGLPVLGTTPGRPTERSGVGRRTRKGSTATGGRAPRAKGVPPAPSTQSGESTVEEESGAAVGESHSGERTGGEQSDDRTGTGKAGEGHGAGKDDAL